MAADTNNKKKATPGVQEQNLAYQSDLAKLITDKLNKRYNPKKKTTPHLPKGQHATLTAFAHNNLVQTNSKVNQGQPGPPQKGQNQYKINTLVSDGGGGFSSLGGDSRNANISQANNSKLTSDNQQTLVKQVNNDSMMRQQQDVRRQQS